MCDPVSMAVATFAVGAGQTIAQYEGDKAAYNVNKTMANLNYANTSNVIVDKRVQLDEAKSENAVDTAIASIKAQGEVAAGAASMGLSGASISHALNADAFGIGRQWEAQDVNDQNQRLQLANEQYGAAISRESQIASKSKPGVLNLALGLGGDALKAAGAYTTAGGKI